MDGKDGHQMHMIGVYGCLSAKVVAVYYIIRELQCLDTTVVYIFVRIRIPWTITDIERVSGR
jgi:hypothetical protein